MSQKPEQSNIHERPLLQIGVFLAGPLAWIVQLLLSYVLITVLCGVISTGAVGILLHLASLGPLLVAAGATWFAFSLFRSHKHSRDYTHYDVDDRSAFMGASATMISLMFLMVILFSWIGVYLISPCA